MQTIKVLKIPGLASLNMSLSCVKGYLYFLCSVNRSKMLSELADSDHAFFLIIDYFAALLLIMFSSIARRLKKLNNEKMTLQTPVILLKFS